MVNWFLGALILWDFLLSGALAVCIGVFLSEDGIIITRRSRHDGEERREKSGGAPRQMTYEEALRAAQMVNLWNYDGSEQTPAGELARQMLYRTESGRRGGDKK